MITALFTGEPFGLPPRVLALKLELLQHSGSFKREAGGVAADSPAPWRVGELTFPLARSFVSETVLLVRGGNTSAVNFN